MPTTYREGDRLPGNLQSWPWCAVCERPVERVVFSRDPVRKDELIEAHCHGDSESIVISSVEINLDGASLGGRVFDRKLLPDH